MITINASGLTLPDLFQNASAQLLALLIDPSEISDVLGEKIVLEATDASGLLQEWLHSLLQLAEHQHIVFHRIRFQEFVAEKREFRLKADVVGELIDPIRHTFRKIPGSFHLSKATVLPEGSAWAAKITF